jgi:S-adenosylmethionine decarboxylase
VIGTHLLADFYDVAAERLTAVDVLRAGLEAAARRCGLTPLAPAAVHVFPGGGVTGFLLLAESHIAFHSYPEHGYLALDVFTCGPSDPHDAVAVFRAALAPGRERVTRAPRGGEVGP